MSDKKAKKGGKKSADDDDGGDGLKGSEKHLQDDVTIQVLLSKTRDLTEKLAR